MRVLVDLLFVTGHRGGMETYVRRIYERMAGIAPGAEFVGLASSELASAGAPWFPGDLVDSGVVSASSLRWAAGEVRLVGPAVRRIRPDVVHCPANIGPGRAGAPVVLTVHDLLPFVHPEWAGSAVSAVALRALTRRAVRGAARILTISEASAADLASRLRPRAPVEVIPLAGDPEPARPLGGPEREGGLLFAPGNRMPHKDQATLLRAIALLPRDRRPRVLVTGSRPGDPLRRLADELGIADRVDLVPWLDDEQLERAYATATAVVLTTRFEGFGLPVLEAMARGCPVICSDLPVLREVGGDAALYAEQGEPRAFAGAIERLLGDPAFRSRASAAGRERAAAFDWATTAGATLRVLTEVADGG